MYKIIILFFIAQLISGCSLTGKVTILPRDGGKVYNGIMEADGFGAGTMTLTIDGRTYTGPCARTATADSFGFIQMYGHGQTSTAFTQTSGGHNFGKAILSSPDNHGMRCEIEGDGMGHGSAICVDDQKQVYDAVILF